MQELSTNDLRWLREFVATRASGKRLLNYRKGAVLFEKGEPIEQVFLISRGQIRVDGTSPQGRAVLIEQCGPHDWLAEGALHEEQFHTNTATALMDSDLIAFARETFPALLHEHAPLLRMFTRGMVKSNKTMRQMLDNRLMNSAHLRLARALISMFGNSEAQELRIEATPKRLGDMVGIARQTADRVIKDFRVAGVLTKLDSERYTLHRAEMEKYLRWAESPSASTAHEMAHYLMSVGDE
ncbi:Crp/Fnr family transcriptional regulator [Bradyrhizobium sp. BRP23]|uniref:Crp/Fnr family transcriptional regulator n=1 Tax=Bradyrhizobium sp. BRP23 TaxID=2793820 RepID=UPI001CD6B4DE|nr:Crp/Fnr family transcriptional regulator [Bradyrhizobium sp. BRP23]MCA1419510.1 Crp/Fnr family transcriptional regulator [Bradyrhizobium sp. BRP23]